MADDRDRFEQQLAERLRAAEAGIDAPRLRPNFAKATHNRERRRGLIAATVVAGAVVAGVVIVRLPHGPTSGSSPSPLGAVRATARDGDITLTLSSPRSAWTSADNIVINAEIGNAGTKEDAAIWGAGGPIVFSLRQVEGGSAQFLGGQRLPCIRYPVPPDMPLVRGFAKFADSQSAPPFDMAWALDPELHLPPGKWEVGAQLDYGINGCENPPRRLDVSIQLIVVLATSKPTLAPTDAMPTSTPAPTGTTPSRAAPDVIFRQGDDATIRYVQQVVPTSEGLLALETTLDVAQVPAAGPVRPTTTLYLGDVKGRWREVDTGQAFAGVQVTKLFRAPDGSLVAYGVRDAPSGGRLWISEDAQNWTSLDVPVAVANGMIVQGARGFVSVVDVKEPDMPPRLDLYWSPDAVHWTKTFTRPSQAEPGDYISDVGAGAEGFVLLGHAGGGEGTFVLASSDGSSWSEASGQAVPGDSAYRLSPFGPDWLAVGFGDGDMPLWRSANGLSWMSAGSIPDPGGFTFTGSQQSFFGFASHLVAVDGRLFLSGALAAEGAASRPRAVWTSTDGRTWTPIDLGRDAEIDTALRIGDQLVLGGRLGDDGGDAVIWLADEASFP